MAPPPSQECTNVDCQYSTPDGIPTWELIATFISNHTQAVHSTPAAAQPDAQAQAHARPRAEKVPRPQIKLGIGQDEFSYFKNRWLSYKRSCGITDETETRDQLFVACHKDLKRNLFSCLGSKLETLTEQQMLAEIEKLAVLPQNNLVNVAQLLALSQDREEPIRAFYARLKASASVCELSVPCTATACTEKVSYSDKMILHALVRGITDEEIREQDRRTRT